jgi:hypothetical protein
MVAGTDLNQNLSFEELKSQDVQNETVLTGALQGCFHGLRGGFFLRLLM